MPDPARMQKALWNMPTLTATVGSNADLLADILSLHVPFGSTIADVTYGKGVFWQKVHREQYHLLASDLQTGVDFRSLPYEDASIDCVVLDPPYMHGGETVKASINDCYRNENESHESVIRLYAGGLLEACRVVKKGGILIVKCQDEIESGKQRLSHVEIIDLMQIFGVRIIDLFVLVQPSTPAMREEFQKTARKNHSYALVGKFSR